MTSPSETPLPPEPEPKPEPKPGHGDREHGRRLARSTAVFSAATAVYLYIYPYRNGRKGAARIRTATVESALEGLVRYTWISADTNVAGLYYLEWKADFPTGRRSFPSDRDFSLQVT